MYEDLMAWKAPDKPHPPDVVVVTANDRLTVVFAEPPLNVRLINTSDSTVVGMTETAEK
jgi:hypothetical protein